MFLDFTNLFLDQILLIFCVILHKLVSIVKFLLKGVLP